MLMAEQVEDESVHFERRAKGDQQGLSTGVKNRNDFNMSGHGTRRS